MTCKERVINAIKHKKVDFLPYELDLTEPVHEKLVEYFNDENFLFTKVNNHMVRARNLNHTFIDSESYIDIFGIKWQVDDANGDIGIVKKYFLESGNLSDYDFPEPDQNLIRLGCSNLEKNFKDKFKIFELCLSFFERAWTLRGMEDLLTDFLINEEFANLLLDKITEYNLKAIDIAAEYDIDCIYFGDDWGQQQGLIMGYPIWKKFLYPRLKKMYDRVKKHNMFIIQHSCGDNYQLFKDLIEIGLDVYNTFQPEIYNPSIFKKEFGKDLTIYGGISVQGVLAQGTPEEVYEETKQMMEILGEDGAYIVAPTHQCTPDVSIDNIMAFLKAVQNQ